jgi:hypothetical protein
MFYAWDIEIPAATPEDDPVLQKLKISQGVIVKVQIKFPSGCHGLAKVRIKRWNFQIWPLSAGEWVTGDDETIDVPEYYDFSKGPYELTFVGCSPNATFNHLITVRVVVLPKVVASFAPLADMLGTLLSRIIGPVSSGD